MLILDAIETVSVDLLELPHVGGVDPQLPEQVPRLLQHAGPVHQAGQRDPALQVDVVIELNTRIQEYRPLCVYGTCILLLNVTYTSDGVVTPGLIE